MTALVIAVTALVLVVSLFGLVLAFSLARTADESDVVMRRAVADFIARKRKGRRAA